MLASFYDKYRAVGFCDRSTQPTKQLMTVRANDRSPLLITND